LGSAVFGLWFLVFATPREPRSTIQKPFVYQLAFLTPGMNPASAISLKQMRQMPNRRRGALARPQRLQRLRRRTLNLGFNFVFSTSDFGAI